MGEFDGIRPYQDDEVPGVLLRLQQDRDLLQTLARYRFPRLNRWLPGLAAWLVAGGVRRELQGVTTVDALQRRLEPWLAKVIERSALQVTYSGLENLSKTRPHLFLANHRDIAMDPAFVNYALYHGGHPTPRIAIGDNLLQRAFDRKRLVTGVQTCALPIWLEPWLVKVIERSALQVTYSGLENLSKTRPHLFLANHRDIAMDPAFVNYALYHGGHPTPRIAIGDNLLQRSFVGDLMRLNKCFIV